MSHQIAISHEFSTFFLLLLSAGYEKNTEGRLAFDEESITRFLELVQQEQLLSNFVRSIQQLSLVPTEYIRLAHYVLRSPESSPGPFSDAKQNEVVRQWWNGGAENALQTIIKNESVHNILNNHHKRLNTIPDYTNECLLKELQPVADFLHLSSTDTPTVYLQVNGFERFGRATNYAGQRQWIVAPVMTGTIAWRSVRHEFLHLILKKIFPHHHDYQYGITPVSEEYKNDSARVQFEENCVAALSLFFLSDQSRPSNHRYFRDRGFSRIDELVAFFITHCHHAGEPLSAALLQQLCQQLQKS